MGVYPVDLQRFGVKIGAFEGFDVPGDRLARGQRAKRVHIEYHCSNLEQGILNRIKASRLHVDNDGQETAKALGQG